MASTVPVLGVPWDVTSTYRTGSHQSPMHIASVSHQLDETHPFVSHTPIIQWLQTPLCMVKLQQQYGPIAHRIIDTLNNNQQLTSTDIQHRDHVNAACRELNQWVYDIAMQHLDAPMIVCGGEHGVGLGYVRALSEHHPSFSILHIDSHMDCYQNYHGFEYSHASILTHYASLPSVSDIVQVGIRDYANAETKFQSKSLTQFHVFDDYSIHKRQFEGETWAAICQTIVNALSDTVLISLDVDGLMPYLCPNTGTPVPGGLSYNQLVYLLHRVMLSKRVIGAELVEVNVGSHTDWDANVGARLLFLLAGCLNGSA
ncbi:MAG: arginase family protein [Candidatus Margulisbacteria bacterium]|nr:arginase family protein [Candidatus Margulisiibacteriota bacterium]